MYNLTTPALLILILFTFGSTIFYVLLLVERRAWFLVFRPTVLADREAEVRFVHRSLKHLIPVLPPSNGIVVVGGFAAIMWQSVQLGWSWRSATILAFWILGQGYIILFGRIASAIKDVRDTPSDAAIDIVSRGVRQLIRQHRNGLIHAAGVLVLQLTLVTVRGQPGG